MKPLRFTLATTCLLLLLATVMVAGDVQAQATRAVPLQPATIQAGVYQPADHRWSPEELAGEQDDVLFDNTNFTGGFLPADQTPAGGPPVVVLDWGLSPGGTVRFFEIGYATDLPGPVTMCLRFYRGTTDDANGEEVASFELDNLPGSASGQFEVITTVIDISQTPFFLPPGPFGYSYEIKDNRTGPLMADGGTGITDAYRVFPSLENLLIAGFFAQFHLKLLGRIVLTWFVDNVRPNGDGSLNNPFNNVADAQAAAGPYDTLFLFTGNGPYGGISLQMGQKLVGQGVGLMEDGEVVVAPGDPPVITNPGGSGVDVADDTYVGGLTFQDNSGAGFHAEGVSGWVNVRRTTFLGGTTGIHIGNSTATYNFDDGVMINGSATGIAIEGTAQGSVNFSPIDINNTTTAGIDINGGSGTFTFSSVDINNTGSGTGLQFNNADGAYDFEGGVSLNGADAGIDIIGSSAGTFTFSGLTSISHSAGTGVNVQGGNNDVTFDRLNINGGETGVRVQGDGTGKPRVRVNGGQVENVSGKVFFVDDIASLSIVDMILLTSGQGLCVNNTPDVTIGNVTMETLPLTLQGEEGDDAILGWDITDSRLGGLDISVAGGLVVENPINIDGISLGGSQTTVSGSAKTAGVLGSLAVTVGGSAEVAVVLTGSTVETSEEQGVIVRTTDAAQATVTLTGNDVSAATTDFLLSQEDTSTLHLVGFAGGDADAVAAFVQANNVGNPSVSVEGDVGSGTGVAVEEPGPVAESISLAPTYPNPFSQTTTFPLRLSTTAHVTLRIYDLRGRLVRTLVDRRLAPGALAPVWDGLDDQRRPVASGLYVVRLRAGPVIDQQTVILLR